MRALLMCGLLLAAVPARADRGLMPFEDEVQIFEPKQEAIIAWNGSEEILLLRTEVHASKSVKALEMMPLPAEPRVKAGDRKAFAVVERLIESRLPRQKGFAGDLADPFMNGPAPRPAGEVTFQRKIGAHDVAVTRALDGARFNAWVAEFLARKGLPAAKVPAPLQGLVQTYLKEGFVWFVFDLVELTRARSGIDPLQQRFRTNSLYYPLRISRLGKGWTSARLVMLTPQRLGRPIRQPAVKGRALCRSELPPFTITRKSQERISKDMTELLRNQEKVFLTSLICSGKLAAFDSDLLIGFGTETAAPSSPAPKRRPPRKPAPGASPGPMPDVPAPL